METQDQDHEASRVDRSTDVPPTGSTAKNHNGGRSDAGHGLLEADRSDPIVELERAAWSRSRKRTEAAKQVLRELLAPPPKVHACYRPGCGKLTTLSTAWCRDCLDEAEREKATRPRRPMPSPRW